MGKLLIFGALLLAGCTTVPDKPPANLFVANVEIVDDPHTVCSKFAPLEPGQIYNACTLINFKTIFMPDPCGYEGEEFASLFCHEGLHITYGLWHN